jgi:hypothetical protein
MRLPKGKKRYHMNLDEFKGKKVSIKHTDESSEDVKIVEMDEYGVYTHDVLDETNEEGKPVEESFFLPWGRIILIRYRTDENY